MATFFSDSKWPQAKNMSFSTPNRVFQKQCIFNDEKADFSLAMETLSKRFPMQTEVLAKRPWFHMERLVSRDSVLESSGARGVFSFDETPAERAINVVLCCVVMMSCAINATSFSIPLQKTSKSIAQTPRTTNKKQNKKKHNGHGCKQASSMARTLLQCAPQ